ncbi:MAG: HEAT repeat domain-containing protein [Deltaproteobacteria bacterium]|nr:HEAT repeat domain-containing protein [Deltaproteobacteria bacterium]
MNSEQGGARQDTVPEEGQASMTPKETRALDTAVERIRFLEWRLAQVEETLATERRALCTQRDALRSAEARHEEDARTIEALRARREDEGPRTPHLEPEFEHEHEHEHEQEAQGEPSSRASLEPNLRSALEHAEARIEFLEQSREHIFRRLVQWQQAADVSADPSIDLGEFIAELRAEILTLSKENAAASMREAELRSQLEAAGLTPRPSSAPSSARSSVPSSALSPTPPSAPYSSGFGLSPPASDRPRRRIGFVSLPPISMLEEREALPHPETVPDDEASARPMPSIEAGDADRTRGVAKDTQVVARAHVVPDSVGKRTDEPAPEERLPASARRLIEEIQHGRSARARLTAAGTLVERTGPLAARPLIAALTTRGDPEEQTVLLRLIAQSGNRDVVGEVIDQARSTSAPVRAAAWDAAIRLASDNPHVLQAAIDEALSDVDARVRRRAVLSLAALEMPGLSERLIPLLFDHDAQTRRVVCVALGAFDTPATRRALASVLLDEVPAVRTAAAGALGRMLGEDLGAIAIAQDIVRRRAVSRLRARLVLEEPVPYPSMPTPMSREVSPQRFVVR